MTCLNSKVNKIFDKVAPLIDSLQARWQDEHEYENWNDYVKVLRGSIQDAGGKFIRASNKPFGVTFSVVREGKFKIVVNRNNIKIEYA